MTDELNPDGAMPFPSEPAPTGADLDRLLAEAADLAAEVTAEVGALPVRTRFENVPIDSLDADATDIGQKLDDLDRLLDRTAHELGADSPDAMTANDVSPPPAASMPVPDFMSEFMDPQEPVPKAAAPVPHAPIAPSKPAIVASAPSQAAIDAPAPVPDFMNEFTQPEDSASARGGNPHALTPPIPNRNPPKLGVVGSPIEPIDVLEEPQLVSVASASSASALAPAAPARPPVVSTGGPAVTLQSVPADPPREMNTPPHHANEAQPGKTAGKILPLATVVVRSMEVIDGPFARLGPRPRRIIGMLAVLIFAAALIVFVASFL